MLGAGTIAEHLADRQIQAMGLQFASTYVVYDVRLIGNLKLLKLRNPPGDHDEWKGDWSDKSELWTLRLKYKLDVQDVDDNCFWMSFDDFVNAFRCIYVCKWFDPTKWKTNLYHAAWNLGSDDQHDTSAGLPCKHNPGCELENNPHWALYIHRPTDVTIKFTQVDANGHVPSEFLPASGFLVRPTHKGVASRVKELSHDNIIDWTGQPERKAEMSICQEHLPAGVYMIMVGTYVAGLEGPITMSVTSNYDVRVDQVWPPVWAPGEAPVSMMERLASGAAAAGAVAAAGAAAAAKKAAEEAQKAKEKMKSDDDDLGLGNLGL